MTKIIYKEGDILEGEEMFILHGCNAQGVMGAGVALAIRKKYPRAYASYQSFCFNKKASLGVCLPSTQPDGKTILNGITQKWFGRDGKQYVDYDAVREVVLRVNGWIHNTTKSDWTNNPTKSGLTHIAMPKIGAGLAGGDWETIAEIIEEHSTNFQPVVYVWEGK